MRAARRLLIPTETIQKLLPDHGYYSSDDFRDHLEQLHRCYKTVRSAAARHSGGAVVASLGRPTHVPRLPPGPAPDSPGRRNPRRRRLDREYDDPNPAAHSTGITDKEELVTRALTNVANPAVAHTPTSHTHSQRGRSDNTQHHPYRRCVA